MAKLIYSAITSLDGYVADEDGNFDWAAPDEEVHTFINDLERPVGTYLYGQAIKAGVVDEWHLFLTPIAVGGGKRSLPDNVRLKLELLDERRFGNGVVHLCYRTRT
jgi:dihydrofolate reductase